MSSEKSSDDYSLKAGDSNATFDAPILPYTSPSPKNYRHNIALIGCGGITQTHLTAYKNAGWNVVAFCDKLEANAARRRDEWFPDAQITTDVSEVLGRGDIDVVDIATHPRERVPLIRAALNAKKHVLSQKPFVLDLDTGQELADLADANNVRLAVNQNGRWAPHFAYLREAVGAGHIGDLMSIHARVHWDHTWVKGTPFEQIRELVLYDFAIHWFDFVATVLTASNRRIETVFATHTRAHGQTIAPAMLAQVQFTFEGGQGSLVFDANTPFGAQDQTYLAGTRGSLWSHGPDLGAQTVTLFNAAGRATPNLSGQWFPDGFAGTMGELLCAIEENRQPHNSARDNLNSLAFCFAAIASAQSGQAVVPGTVRQLPPGSVPDVRHSAR